MHLVSWIHVSPCSIGGSKEPCDSRAPGAGGPAALLHLCKVIRDQLSEKRVRWSSLSLSLSLAMRSSSRCIRWDYILQHFSFERTSSRFVSNDNVDTQRDAFDESALVNASNKSKCVLLREVQTRTRVLRQFSPILWLTFVRHKALMLKIEITWTTGLRVSWIRKAPKYRDREIISIFCIFCIFCTCLLKRLLG